MLKSFRGIKLEVLSVIIRRVDNNDFGHGQTRFFVRGSFQHWIIIFAGVLGSKPLG